LGNLLLSNGKSSTIGLLNNGKCGRNCIGGIVGEKSCVGAENQEKTAQTSMNRLAARGWPPTPYQRCEGCSCSRKTLFFVLFAQ